MATETKPKPAANLLDFDLAPACLGGAVMPFPVVGPTI